MKINGIKALDYQEKGDQLVITMEGTSIEEITGMNTAMLLVTTDDGDRVECFVGYQVTRVVYEAATGAYMVVLAQQVDDATGKALTAITEQMERLEAGQQVVSGPVVAAVCTFAAISTEIPDASALEMATLFPAWEDVLQKGAELAKGRIISDDGQLYRVEQAVTPQTHQTPHDDGMLAIYRPIDKAHAGTLDDPIPWVYGMDCLSGTYYSYNGAIYRVADGGNMTPCTWQPDTAGMWQWETIQEVD